MDEEKLIEKLRLIEALHAGAATPGERVAAQHAQERIRERLRKVQNQEKEIEHQFSILDPWGRKLFVALARRYGMKPYRLRRQRRSTLMLRAPKSFVDDTLWPEFIELDRTLRSYLDDITDKVIRESIHADDSDAEMRNEPLRIDSPEESERTP
jgi:hypothetical protein